jgi:uncharacterized protein YceK
MLTRTICLLLAVAALAGGCSAVSGKDGAVNKPGCPKPTEQGRSSKEAVVEEYLAALQAGCEDQIWSLMSEQAELADGDGYLVGKAGLHRLVEAHCGLKLVNVKVKYGKNTPYDPQPEMEPETTEYDHAIFVTADVAPKPGPHAQYTQWMSTDHTVERRAGKKTHNWYLAMDTVVKESQHIDRVPGESPCFHHELIGQLRDSLVKSNALGSSLVQVIPRDLSVEGEGAVLKVETASGSGQDFYGARFERSDGEWRLGSIEYDPDDLGHG